MELNEMLKNLESYIDELSEENGKRQLREAGLNGVAIILPFEETTRCQYVGNGAGQAMATEAMFKSVLEDSPFTAIMLLDVFNRLIKNALSPSVAESIAN